MHGACTLLSLQFVLVLHFFSLIRATSHETVEYITATVERGDVTEVISVSGSIEANQTADLAFPVSGSIASITVTEGDTVQAGDTLATLAQADLVAEQQDARAALLIAQADKRELLRGPTYEARAVTNRNVAIAEDNRARITREQDEIVAHAQRTLLSSNLEAVPVRKNNNDTSPTITGIYQCAPGTYTIAVFGSEAASGYSYRLSGLERGTFTAYTEATAPLGTCGLAIQFADDETYSNADWTVTIPNTLGATYTANLNAYEFAVQRRDNAIDAATQALQLEQEKALLANADPRTESVARADAAIMQAQARLAAIDAQLQDHTLTAPFDGVITARDGDIGESVGTTPLITMVANDTFKLKARIPEIDITKITHGLPATIRFDARVDAPLPATVTFISPLAIEIDGVAYFEATLAITTPPDWIRGGLNADIDIEVYKAEQVLRIPKRFVTTQADDTHTVLVPYGDTTQSITVTRGFVGNDGFVEIIGLNEGDIVVAP